MSGWRRALLCCWLCCWSLPTAYALSEAEALLGRLLLLAFEGDQAPVHALETIEPAGFLFYPSNVRSEGQVRQLSRQLQQASPYPLLLGIDQEGGPFSSYRTAEATLFPGNMALAAASDPELARAVAYAIGRELAYLGFNLNFAPVVDVNSNPDNPIIGVRAFSSDPQQVSLYGQAFHAGLEAAGIAAVAKHFPGHGDTALDSHLALPRVEASLEQLWQRELLPFVAMVEAAVPAVMSAHVLYPALDPHYPATLSAAALSGLLREELGFDGLIISDYMDMAAIRDHHGAGEAAVLSVLAGADVLLLGPDPAMQQQVLASLREALQQGRLPAERVLAAVGRSQALAQRFPVQFPEFAPDRAAHRALALRVAKQAVTLLHNDGALPLPADASVTVIAPQPGGFGASGDLAAALTSYHTGVSSLAFPNDEAALETVLEQLDRQPPSHIVLGVYHWLGDFPAHSRRVYQALQARDSQLIVVAMGNPDSWRWLTGDTDPQAAYAPQAYVAVYGYRAANLEAAASLLSGYHLPQGRLPMPVGDFPRGFGQEGF